MGRHSRHALLHSACSQQCVHGEEYPVIIEKFETSWRDVDRLKWVTITVIHRARFLELVMEERGPPLPPPAVLEIQEAAFW